MKKILFISIFSFILSSCIAQNYKIIENSFIKKNEEKPVNLNTDQKETIQTKTISKNSEKILSETVHVVLPIKENKNYTTNSFLNTLELAVYNIDDDSIKFKIDRFSNEKEIDEIFSQYAESGKIFIGPLSSQYTRNIKQYCKRDVIIFSFAADRSLAGDCVYLFNFFIEDDLKRIFLHLNESDKLALIYPDNNYGRYLNSIIDNYSSKSKSTLIYRLAYNENLENIRSVIKQISKYEYRKSELERQKKLLKERNDEVSLASLKKLEAFETIGNLDFNHLIISDGNIRILEIAPLLTFYDIDQKTVQFVGTGLWDDKSFFDEPSLQGAIFPGVESSNRQEFISQYRELHSVPPPRTTTVMYDVVSLTNYLVNNFNNIQDVKLFLKDNNNFFGLDGSFSITNNIISRDLSILQIDNGYAQKIN
ncbi:MAG: hypothetical protein CFH21_00172 [Alphaproteobacteria bacterium MarineAlpha5_Bin11]|nr:MAG: hypothetical protein CFH21_00172 [Alphaproteobacteria bacterium MarineAlpha5_Bin11]PPR51821.1 MAG: hypothetical protein CFH20_00239 [Alphaproteobacteria bacterium MarineAlpha5_Bin10]|tara:strand:+ start:1429 stop:2694 length:1266 start_codon:yes stop_codon:yes gene_type:complete